MRYTIAMTLKREYSAMNGGDSGGGSASSTQKRPRPTVTVTGKRKREIALLESSSESEVDLKRLAISPRQGGNVGMQESDVVPENIYTKQNLELREYHFLRQQRKLMARHSESRCNNRNNDDVEHGAN